MQGLNDDDINDTFTVDMHRFPPRTFSELISEAQKFVVAADCIIARHKTRVKPPSREPERRVPPRQQIDTRRERNNRDRNVRGPLRQSFHNYTGLTAPRSEILMQLEGRNILQPPPPLRTPDAKKNRRKYCRFHRDHDHDTEGCFNLKDEIEHLVRQG